MCHSETLLQVRGQPRRVPPDHRPRPDSDTTTRPRTTEPPRRTRAAVGAVPITSSRTAAAVEAYPVMRPCTAPRVYASDHGPRVPPDSRRCANVTIDLITMKWVQVKIPSLLSVFFCSVFSLSSPSLSLLFCWQLLSFCPLLFSWHPQLILLSATMAINQLFIFTSPWLLLYSLIK